MFHEKPFRNVQRDFKRDRDHSSPFVLELASHVSRCALGDASGDEHDYKAVASGGRTARHSTHGFHPGSNWQETGQVVDVRPSKEPGYHSPGNQFERFRGFLELVRRFEFEFCRRENFFFLKDSNFWCVHVNVPWPVCAHAIHFECCGVLDDS